MALPRRDDAFVSFVDAERAALLATAYLVHGDAARSTARVDGVLARTYARWPAIRDARLHAWTDLLTSHAVEVAPWHRNGGLELIDASPVTAPEPERVVADLGLLTDEQRRVLVLATVAGLSTTEVAGVTGLAPERIVDLRRGAVEVLALRDPNRHEESLLRAELTTAARHAFTPEQRTGEDLAHGRMLVSRRRTRRGLAAAAILVVLALTVTQLVGSRRAPEAAAPTPVSTSAATPVNTGCAVEDTSCRVTLTNAWRNQIWSVARSYVDPDHAYFTGYSYGYEPTYDDDSLWAGKGGALGLDLYRLEDGSTEVFVQVASEREFAPRCGLTTKQDCVRMRFMDGNWITVTETTSVAEGIEVQYSPDGVQVVTVIARNVTRGTPMKIGRGDLISLAEDDRLRLPRI